MKTSHFIVAGIALASLLANAADAQGLIYPFVEVNTPTASDRIIMTYNPEDGHVEANAPHDFRWFELKSNSGLIDTDNLAHPEEFQGPFDVVRPDKLYKTLSPGVGWATYMDIGEVVPADMDFEEFTSEFSMTALLVGFPPGVFQDMSDPPGYGLYIPSGLSMPGDYNGNGSLDSGDLDMQAAAIASQDLSFDENGDGVVDFTDRSTWVHEFRNTWIGDANLDGEFNSDDMVQVFQASTYELDVDAGWAQGDWTGDLRFESGDMVAAFIDGGYELAARAALNAVPEPVSLVMFLVGLMGIAIRRRYLGVAGRSNLSCVDMGRR